eukprot:gnl/TRDRNA2_/TRDRNA2_80856_c0_seq1.p1 gnl/TRDRNA2_/TRDRNA2_80856_c0~~gnl/TRDRNA2_/TRDRNA2_80856_c0_seq1.p1  ORF type:complete len:251 (+),score=9.74 gnl/TRDRNA2_/TRDRNA2_80856_c0_seq1:49-801(+)
MGRIEASSISRKEMGRFVASPASSVKAMESAPCRKSSRDVLCTGRWVCTPLRRCKVTGGEGFRGPFPNQPQGQGQGHAMVTGGLGFGGSAAPGPPAGYGAPPQPGGYGALEQPAGVYGGDGGFSELSAAFGFDSGSGGGAMYGGAPQQGGNVYAGYGQPPPQQGVPQPSPYAGYGQPPPQQGVPQGAYGMAGGPGYGGQQNEGQWGPPQQGGAPQYGDGAPPPQQPQEPVVLASGRMSKWDRGRSRSPRR